MSTEACQQLWRQFNALLLFPSQNKLSRLSGHKTSHSDSSNIIAHIAHMQPKVKTLLLKQPVMAASHHLQNDRVGRWVWWRVGILLDLIGSCMPYSDCMPYKGCLQPLRTNSRLLGSHERQRGGNTPFRLDDNESCLKYCRFLSSQQGCVTYGVAYF